MTRLFDNFENNNRLQFRVLRTDSRVGLTFAVLACEAPEGSERRIRNQSNARKAYDTVLSFSRKTSFTPAEWQELAANLDDLKSTLEELGEHFSDGESHR